MSIRDICREALDGGSVSVSGIHELLDCPEQDYPVLQQAAQETRRRYVGDVLHLRGLIEFSNICSCDCRYCGIRKSNRNTGRYTMTMDDIICAAETAYSERYGSVVLQSGEHSDPQFTDFVTEMVQKVKAIGDGSLGITLSCGIQTPEVYRRWRAAGADRYLLRIETTDRELFGRLHPDTDFDVRCQALRDLKSAGYILGTGVMVGLPGQTTEMLSRDIDFFRSIDADMIGLGPYVTHPDAVLEDFGSDSDPRRKERLFMTCKMISVCRLVLKDVNIASATALSALDPKSGRLRGLLAGANVIMPNTGNPAHRKDYFLYDNKPDTAESLHAINSLAALAGCSVELGTPGNPPHFK